LTRRRLQVANVAAAATPAAAVSDTSEQGKQVCRAPSIL
jgi:hypothetical protein